MSDKKKTSKKDKPKHKHESEKEIINIFIENKIFIPKEHGHHQKVRQVLVNNFSNNKSIIIMLSLPANQKGAINIALVDADSLQPITATFEGETETSDNPAAAVADVTNGLVGIAPGTGNLISKATWTYTDKNTNQLVTAEQTTTTPFEVTAVVAAERVQMVVTLGNPVHQ